VVLDLILATKKVPSVLFLCNLGPLSRAAFLVYLGMQPTEQFILFLLSTGGGGPFEAWLLVGWNVRVDLLQDLMHTDQDCTSRPCCSLFFLDGSILVEMHVELSSSTLLSPAPTCIHP